MGFNRENYRRIKREYDGKNLKAKEAAERRREELHSRFSDIKEIDDALSLTGLKILEASSKYTGKQLDQAIEKLKKENAALLRDRADCLVYHGYPADYSDVKYECTDCSDTGFVGIKMCHCMKERLILAGYESSGIGNLITSKSFENFDPSYRKKIRKPSKITGKYTASAKDTPRASATPEVRIFSLSVQPGSAKHIFQQPLPAK